jgi:ribosomal-protein-alanine N-acetyltransferase
MIDDYPTLETSRLRLRPIESGDLDFVFRHFSDPLVHRYLEDAVTTLEQARAIVDSYLPSRGKTWNRWIMLRREDARPIGTCGFHKWSVKDRRCELGYDLEPASWGYGYMGEALRAALAFGFREMELDRVEAVAAVENRRSLRLLERLGFVREGLLRETACRNGVRRDDWLLSLVHEEWAVRTTVADGVSGCR